MSDKIYRKDLYSSYEEYAKEIKCLSRTKPGDELDICVRSGGLTASLSRAKTPYVKKVTLLATRSSKTKDSDISGNILLATKDKHIDDFWTLIIERACINRLVNIMPNWQEYQYGYWLYRSDMYISKIYRNFVGLT